MTDTDIASQNGNSADFFSLKGHVTDAKIVKVYDGDTVHAVFRYFGAFYKWRCRIAHVDTPEMRSDNAQERQKANMARDKLAEKLLNKVVRLECFEFDKYGRVLVEIDMPNETGIKVHDWLIANGYAKRYEGGSK